MKNKGLSFSGQITRTQCGAITTYLSLSHKIDTHRMQLVLYKNIQTFFTCRDSVVRGSRALDGNIINVRYRYL